MGGRRAAVGLPMRARVTGRVMSRGGVAFLRRSAAGSAGRVAGMAYGRVKARALRAQLAPVGVRRGPLGVPGGPAAGALQVVAADGGVGPGRAGAALVWHVGTRR